ncbi:hemolysin family protein [Luteibaculum oceani]|uniref:HlyC/CorC family transporter n=1 Tax=Luteibaculum oceani TaxID=1294296 RepID=A0A5C6UTP8_9FLAO|nr:hemolysin family protein [Luteibaculum oceani]TXC75616.1 HlyC/CorC family transporter [Luteibaculum oceani]
MDTDDPLVSILIILATILASAFFSGSEIAFVSANRLKIELDNKQGTFQGKILGFLFKRPSQFIGAMLVGNNIALVIFGIQMGAVLTPFLTHWFGFGEGSYQALICETLISTLIILVTAEFLPKVLFSVQPNNALSIFAFPLVIVFFLLWIPMIITVGISEFVLKRVLGFSISDNQSTPNFGKVDLDHYVKEVLTGSSNTEDVGHEIQIFQNALDFSKIKARDCMIPRNEIVAIDIEESLENLRKKFIETKLSKVLVYRDNTDNVIGYVHSFDLFAKPESIKNILRQVFIIPESKNIQEALKQFIDTKIGIAVVVDEFGGTSGMLTIEDVIEEIVGEIEDEHDADELTEIKISNDEYLFSGRLEIDEINEKFRLNLPESEEYDTLAGLVLFQLGEIPKKGVRIQIPNYLLTVESASQTKIELLRVIVKQDI